MARNHAIAAPVLEIVIVIPMQEEPMADVQKWIEELRAGKVVGRIVLTN